MIFSVIWGKHMSDSLQEKNEYDDFFIYSSRVMEVFKRWSEVQN